MICEICGREFTPRGQQKICPACKPRKQPLPMRTCAQCGKEFRPQHSKHVFCSKKCCYKSQPKTTVTQITKNCPYCGKEFKAIKGYKIYCSTKCRIKWYRAHHRQCEGPDRELTPLSVYLIHKDYAEGMGLSYIAKLYGRSLVSVKKALETPLTSEQAKIMVQYMHRERGKQQ